MTRHAVIDPTGNHEENVQRLGKDLGKAKLRRQLFDTVYGRGSLPRSKKELMAKAGIKSVDAQQAQNEIEYLYRRHLIDRIDNDGHAADRSQYVYSKNEFVRANREKIVRAANNPKLAANIPTKRNPAGKNKIVILRHVITRASLKRRQHVDVLYLMANPIKRHTLRVDAEIKAVNAEVKRSKFCDNITLHQSPAADYDDVLHGLNDHNPRIVHFSGHGNSSGLAMDGGGGARVKTKFVSFDLLRRALAATDSPPHVVVLNACDSASARKALLGTVKAIIGMEDSISDIAAVAFATKFYGAVASGQSLQAAYDQGCAAVAAVSLNEALIPSLSMAKGVNAKKLFLA